MSEGYRRPNIVDLRARAPRLGEHPDDPGGNEAMDDLQIAREELDQVDAGTDITAGLTERVVALDNYIRWATQHFGLFVSQLEKVWNDARVLAGEHERLLETRFHGDIPDNCQLAFEIDSGFYQVEESLRQLMGRVRELLPDYTDLT